MKKFILSDKKRREASFPLGGIGTGCTYLLGNGALGKLETMDCHTNHGESNPFFAIKAESGGKLLNAKIAAEKDISSSDDVQNSLYFSGCEFASYFPFADIKLTDSDFPGEITLTAFNPFIPLNGTDSGIPAAFFEFEVLNTSESAIDYTICSVCDNLLPVFRNTAGCTGSGAAYIFMDSKSELSKSLEGNTCIATDGKNISFSEHLPYTSVSHSDFLEFFSSSHTFNDISSNYNADDGIYCALATHFSLNPDEKKKVKFLISRYNPYSCFNDKGIDSSVPAQDEECCRRNYYAQYFESSVECASYCIKHWDRLKKESLRFTETLLDSTLDDSILQAVCDGLCLMKGANCLRLDDGTFYSNDYSQWLFSQALLHLFPMLCRSMLQNLIMGAIDENGNMTSETPTMLAVIINSYRDFKLSGNEDELIENWYYLSKVTDCSFDKLGLLLNDGIQDVNAHIKLLYLDALTSAKDIAFIVKDKKRYEAYSALLEKYEALTESQALTEEVLSEKSYPAAENMLYGRNADEALQLISSLTDLVGNESMESYALLGAMSGFEYDAYKKHIGFSPLSDHCPLDFGDTFRCFFSVCGGYGYVEEGIDYIEVNMVSGKLDIRSFGVPRTPRIVQYGGRNWRFSDTGLCATLDTNLEVTPDKKLTILIDIKSNK